MARNSTNSPEKQLRTALKELGVAFRVQSFQGIQATAVIPSQKVVIFVVVPNSLQADRVAGKERRARSLGWVLLSLNALEVESSPKLVAARVAQVIRVVESEMKRDTV
jgi:hypothetical protein